MKCPHCEREYPETEDPRACPFCGEPRQTEKETSEPYTNGAAAVPPGQTSPSPPPGYCPWEDQEHLGFMEGILQTVKLSLFSPQLFFSRLPKQGGLLAPLLYALILDTLGTMVSFLWSMALGNAFPEVLGVSGGSGVALGLLIPVLVFISIMVWAVVLHVSLFLVGGAHEDFEATFRVVCYTSGVEIFSAVPIIGGIVKSIWKLYITVIGVREVHAITTGRAVAALCIPLVLCCGIPLVGLLVVLMVAAL